MKTLVIVAQGDNVALHGKALAAACEAVEAVNGAPVYRAYIQGEPSPSTESGPPGSPDTAY